jgi:hypothetical protein
MLTREMKTLLAHPVQFRNQFSSGSEFIRRERRRLYTKRKPCAYTQTFSMHGLDILLQRGTR